MAHCRSPLAAAIVVLLAVDARAQTFPPPPSGPLPIGTTIVVLTDSTRWPEWDSTATEPRRLPVQVWYPASPALVPLAPYVPELSVIANDLRDAFPTLDVATLATSAIWHGRPDRRGRFPLVVFSHGMNSARYFYTGLVQALASHGFVVAAVEHPFWSVSLSDPGGHRLPLGRSMASRDRLTSDEIDGLMQEGVAAMAEDQAFVARNLVAAAPQLRGIIDAARTAVVGHSMGGMAATAACWRYRVFDACVSLDGLVWARDGNTALGEPPNPVAKPFLLLLAPQFLPPDFSVPARRYHRVWPRLALCLLPGSRHNSVSDLPLLRRTVPAAGDLPPAAAAGIMQRAVVAFLRSTLGEPSVPTDPEPSGSSLRSALRAVPGDSVVGCTVPSE